MDREQRQHVKDILYTSASIASNAIHDAAGEIWAAVGEYIEFAPYSAVTKIDRAILLLQRAIQEVEQARKAIPDREIDVGRP